MAKVGELFVDVLARTGGLQSGLKRGEKSISSFQSRANTMLGVVAKIGAAVGGMAVLKWAAGLAAEAEQAEVAMSTMLGSAEKGKQMVSDLRDFAASTPLQTTDLQQATQTLLAFGVSGEQIIPTLRMLGDAAGGNSERFKSMALVFGQISAAGKLTGGDLLQLINAGFNPLKEISERTGESMESLKDRMSKGQISIDEVRESFASATGPGGMFFQMMEKQSKTLNGRLSTLKDNVGLVAMQFAEILLPAIGKVVDIITGLVEWFKELDQSTKATMLMVGTFVTTFGLVIAIIPKVIAAFGFLRAAYAALTTAQTIQQAMSGPAGWATLAAGAVIAGVAVAGVAYSYNELNKEMEAAGEGAEALEKPAEAANNSAKKAVGNAKKELSAVQKRLTEVRRNLEKVRSSWDGITGRGSQASFEAVVKYKSDSSQQLWQDRTLDLLEWQEEHLKKIAENTEEIGEDGGGAVVINEIRAH